MKKGVLISGIITIASYAIVALVFLTVGIVNIVSKGMADADPGAIPAEELTIVAIVFVVLVLISYLAQNNDAQTPVVDSTYTDTTEIG